MAALPEKDEWSPEVYQIETSDPVLGGPDGIDNLQAKQLSNRTRWLRNQIQRLLDGVSSVGKAVRLETARVIRLKGALTGSASFDGSADAEINATLADSGVVAGTYTKVAVSAKGLVVGGERPTTLSGYGITDALSRTGGEVDGPITLLSARSLILRAGQTSSFAAGLVGASDADETQGGIGFFGGQSTGYTRGYLALGPTPWANGYGVRVDREAGVEVAGPVKFTGVIDGDGSKITNLAWRNLADHPTTLGGYGITDALSAEGGTVTGNLLLARAHSIMLRASDTESFASGLMALTDTDLTQGGIGFFGGVSTGFSRAYIALGPTPWANGNGMRVTSAGIELSGAVNLVHKISGDGSGLHSLTMPFSSITALPGSLAGYGLVMASQTDAETGADNNKPMSALRVFQAIAARVVQASESALGIARIATQIAVNGGTDALSFVTPKTLLFGFYAQFDTNGSIRFPTWAGGWMVQWGLGPAVEAGQTKTISYPLAFPNRVLWTGASNCFSGGSTTMTSTVGVAYGTNEWFTVSAAGSGGQLNVP